MERSPWSSCRRGIHELAVDAERGVILRATSFIDGQEFFVHEVLEIAFDEDFPDDTFVFTPPPGERSRMQTPGPTIGTYPSKRRYDSRGSRC